MMPANGKKYKTLWLIGFCVLVLLMISVGGITRLTRSGLSIVEWKPISGIIPPLTEQDWQNQFDLYKLSPEYNQINSHFGVSEYKNIFLWEYSHRLLGRLIFLFVVLPGFVLWRKKIVDGRLVLTLASLVALQGLIGWLMVKTGLNLRPHVSPYMLALHFFSALFVLIVALYHLCKMQKPLDTPLTRTISKIFIIFGVLLGIQLFYGCITSGLKAGIGYNTYPLMSGKFIPADAFTLQPHWINFFENPGTVQWIHRWVGILLFISLIAIILILKKSSSWQNLKKSFLFLIGLVFFQIILGILNIIYVVPISLAASHQLWATFIVLVYISIIFRMQNTKKNRAR